MRRAIEAHPTNQTPTGSFYRYTAKARRKLVVLDWAITEQQKAKLRVAGKLVTSGYSGRQTKRRK
ncbi:MAG: hypothetical protein JST84_04920 [Acidobacteria bacterium]|nr:hypothetical protein [Acidobacteriota bacterium]